MKKSTKTVLSIAGVLCGIGLFLGIISFVFLSMGYGRGGDIKQRKTETFDIGNISDIALDISIGDVIITTGTEKNITITYPDYETDQYDIRESDDAFSFSEKPFSFFGNVQWFLTHMVNFGSDKNDRIEVKVPADFDGTFDIKSTTGKISCSDFKLLEEAKFIVTTGKVEVYNIIASDDVTFKATSGKIFADDVECQNLTATANTGRIDINNSNCQVAKVKATTGTVSFDNLVSKEIDAQMSTGNILFENLVSDDIDMKTSTGGIQGNINADEDDYEIFSKTSTGRTNLVNQEGDTDKKLSATTSTGRIEIDFE